MVVGFVTLGYALYVRYLVIEFSTVALACDAGLQTVSARRARWRPCLFKNSVFGIGGARHRGAELYPPVDRAADRRTDRRLPRHRALQHRAVGTCDRAVYFGLCAARARHSVSASNR